MDWLFNKTFHHNLSNSSIGAEFKIVENQCEMCYDNVQCALHLNKLIYDNQNLIISAVDTDRHAIAILSEISLNVVVTVAGDDQI